MGWIKNQQSGLDRIRAEVENEDKGKNRKDRRSRAQQAAEVIKRSGGMRGQ